MFQPRQRCFCNAVCLFLSRFCPDSVMMSGEMRMKIICLAAAVAGTMHAQALDFETYKARVEPVFLKKRPGHARCVVCHEAGNSAFRLQPLAEGSTKWTEEQSR